MLNTVGDILTEVLVRNSRKTTDTALTDAILRGWLQDAHLWACSVHKWPFTEGKASTTFSTAITDELGNTVVSYPEGWKADSIRILTIGGKRLQKMDFSSFLRYLENNAVAGTQNNNARIYSDYARQLYVNTGADVSGTLTTYGQYTPAIDPTDLTAVTIFSNFDEEGNEAIVQKMTSYLYQKDGSPGVLVRGKPVSPGIIAEQNAMALLEGIWKRVGDEAYGYQTKDQPMFERVDILRGRGSDNNYNDRFRENQF